MTDLSAAATTTAPSQRPRIFYGWWIVLGAIVAQFVAIGMQVSVSGVFLVPMTEDLDWSRSQFTLATTAGNAISAGIGFFIGAYVDRVGARPLMVIGATIIGAALMAVSRVEELWQFVLLRGVIFAIGFTMVGNLVVNVTVSKWFVRRRGWAISMASLGVSAAGIFMPLIMVPVVDTIGWRDAWIVLGLAVWVLIYPVAMVMRRQPEDHGLLPDGAVEGESDPAEIAEAARDLAESFTRNQAMRTTAMWLLVVAFGFAQVGLISLLFHSIPFLTDSGFSRSQAALLVGSQGTAALLSKFVWGWWMQRYSPKSLAALTFVISGGAVLGMVPAAQAGSFDAMFALFVLWGLGIGGMLPLSEFIWAAYFGRRHLGAVRGAAMPLTIIFTIPGPLLAASYVDSVGTYDGAIIAFGMLWFVGAALVMLSRPPKLSASQRPVAAASDAPPERPRTAEATRTPSLEPRPALAVASHGGLAGVFDAPSSDPPAGAPGDRPGDPQPSDAPRPREGYMGGRREVHDYMRAQLAAPEPEAEQRERSTTYGLPDGKSGARRTASYGFSLASSDRDGAAEAVEQAPEAEPPPLRETPPERPPRASSPSPAPATPSTPSPPPPARGADDATSSGTNGQTPHGHGADGFRSFANGQPVAPDAAPPDGFDGDGGGIWRPAPAVPAGPRSAPSRLERGPAEATATPSPVWRPAPGATAAPAAAPATSDLGGFRPSRPLPAPRPSRAVGPLRPAPGPLTVTLGDVGRALQRRFPRALERYRSDELAPAVAVGVITSAVTVAAIMLLSRRRGGSGGH